LTDAGAGVLAHAPKAGFLESSLTEGIAVNTTSVHYAHSRRDQYTSACGREQSAETGRSDHVRIRRASRAVVAAFLAVAGACTGSGQEHAAAVHETPAVDDARLLVDGGRLDGGVRYTAAGQFQDIDVVFTSPSAPLYGQESRRFVGVSTDPDGLDPVVALVPAAGLRVFPLSNVERTDLDAETIGDVTTPAPDDVVSWLADRPLLNAGPIDEHLRVGNLDGRGFAYQVGRLADRAPLIWASGTTLDVGPDDEGWILELDVAGQPVLAIVRDAPGTTGLLDTLTFEVADVPEPAADARRLPYLAPLEAGRDYYVDRVGRSVGLVLSAPVQPVTASQRDEVVWIGGPTQSPAPRHYYFTVVDASTVVANPNPSLNPDVLVRPGGIVRWELDAFLGHTIPLPDDPVGWLTQQPYVTVVESAHDTEIDGHPARVTDVKAARRFDTVTCPDGIGNCVMPFTHRADAFPIVISSEYVTRIVDLTVGENRLLIAVDLDTPGESVLDSLRAFDLGTT
jgi:hypothetical protein